jgi:hypothetical protein
MQGGHFKIDIMEEISYWRNFTCFSNWKTNSRFMPIVGTFKNMSL